MKTVGARLPRWFVSAPFVPDKPVGNVDRVDTGESVELRRRREARARFDGADSGKWLITRMMELRSAAGCKCLQEAKHDT